MSKSTVRLIAIATPEWHHYCPHCERSCLSRISDFNEELKTTRVVICSSCKKEYEVKNDTCNHSDQPKITRKQKLTCNQIMILLDVYRGTLIPGRHLGTYYNDLKLLRSDSIGLIDFHHSDNGPLFVLTEKGTIYIKNILEKEL